MRELGNAGDGTDILLGTPAQVHYARAIRAHFRRLVGDPDLLPDVSLAVFWIEHRFAKTPRELWDAAASLDTQLLYSPFTAHYPRWGRAEAVATLHLLDRFKVLDLETDGLGKAAQVLEVAVVDQDGAPLFTSLVRPPAMTRLDGIEGTTAQESHGITALMLADAPTLPHVWPRLLSVLTDSGTGMLTAFNADFDLRILRTAAAREGTGGMRVPALTGLCAMKLATAWLDREYYLSLDEVGAALGLARTADETAHRALPDARYTARMVQRLRVLASGRER
jgi:DNA polymerase III epsilon subunit-like protein